MAIKGLSSLNCQTSCKTEKPTDSEKNGFATEAFSRLLAMLYALCILIGASPISQRSVSFTAFDQQQEFFE
jgi:hypothetical protein